MEVIRGCYAHIRGVICYLVEVADKKKTLISISMSCLISNVAVAFLRINVVLIKKASPA